MAKSDTHLGPDLSPEQMDSLAQRVKKCNKIIRELGQANLLNPITLMGVAKQIPLCETLVEDAETFLDKTKSFQVALKVPEGIGVCIWPTTREFYNHSHILPGSPGVRPNSLEKSAKSMFTPFDRLGAFEKSLILPVLDEIEEDLSDIAEAEEALKEDAPRIPFADYLSQKQTHSPADQ